MVEVTPHWRPVKVARDAKVEPRTRKRRTQPNVPEILRLHHLGLKQDEIAERVNLNPSTVSRTLQRQGIVARTKSDYVRVPSKEEIRELYEGESLGYRAVSARLGVSDLRLRELMREYGIPMRREGRPAVSFEYDLDQMRPYLAERSRGACEIRCCDSCRGRGTHAHHRVLRGQGGKNDLENLLHVCIGCHGWIHRAVEADPYGNGWLVRSSDDPGKVLVRLAENVWTLLAPLSIGAEAL